MTSKTLNKIIVVEDEEDIITIVRFALKRFSTFDVVYCASGLEALNKAVEFQPDLILTDMMMPEMDGLSVLKSIKRNPQLAHIPVIFMTAKSQAEEVQSYLKFGAIGVINKPFDPIKLTDQLKSIWQEQFKDDES